MDDEHFSEGDHITLVDGEDKACAHGFIQEIDPDVENLLADKVNIHNTHKNPRLWYVVVINCVLRNCAGVSFQEDTVFAADGAKLTNVRGRSLHQLEGLPSLTGGFLAFKQIIVKRMRAVSKRSRSEDTTSKKKPSKKRSKQ